MHQPVTAIGPSTPERLGVEVETFLDGVPDEEIRAVHIDETTLPQASPETIAQSRSYDDALYRSLGRIAKLPVPDIAIGGIIKHYPGWSYRTEGVAEDRKRILARGLTDPGLTVKRLVPNNDRRAVVRDSYGIRIELNQDVIGDDLRYLIAIERQIQDGILRNHGTRTERAAQKQRAQTPEEQGATGLPQHLRKLAMQFPARYQDATDTYTSEDAVFTEREQLVADLCLHVGTQHEIATILDVGNRTLNRNVFQPLCERLGFKDMADLMLFVIAMNPALIDEVEEGHALSLPPRYQKFLTDFYSTDMEERQKLRGNTAHIGTMWNRIYKKLDIEAGRRLPVLYGVKDKVIELPDKNRVRQLLRPGLVIVE